MHPIVVMLCLCERTSEMREPEYIIVLQLLEVDYVSHLIHLYVATTTGVKK